MAPSGVLARNQILPACVLILSATPQMTTEPRCGPGLTRAWGFRVKDPVLMVLGASRGDGTAAH